MELRQNGLRAQHTRLSWDAPCPSLGRADKICPQRRCAHASWPEPGARRPAESPVSPRTSRLCFGPATATLASDAPGRRWLAPFTAAARLWTVRGPPRAFMNTHEMGE